MTEENLKENTVKEKEKSKSKKKKKSAMLFGFVSPDRASTLLRLLGCSDSTGDSLSTPVQTEGWPRVGEDGRVKGLLQLET